MVVFPNAKINIGLKILSKREDGYHNLQTIFAAIALKDALEVIEAKQGSEGVQFTSSGLYVPGAVEGNLCVQAYQLLKQDFPALPAVQMHLHKTIPMGAGLGGGSADAAFALQLINQKFSLHLTTKQLLSYAGQLGSDCAFFIVNKACYATGRGEILEPINLDLSAYAILLLNPGIHISTSLAFDNIKIGEHPQDLRKLVVQDIDTWKHAIVNDFEETVFAAYPEIALIKTTLYELGALYASMSGSGSSVYGIFPKAKLPAFNFPAHYYQRWV